MAIVVWIILHSLHVHHNVLGEHLSVVDRDRMHLQLILATHNFADVLRNNILKILHLHHLFSLVLLSLYDMLAERLGLPFLFLHCFFQIVVHSL